MNRIQAFKALCETVCTGLGRDSLNIREKGTIAMAVEALLDEAQEQRFIRLLQQCLSEERISDLRYHLLFLACKDWNQRVAPRREEIYCAMIRTLWEEKKRKAQQKQLESFEWFGGYSDYPDFFQALDLMDELIKDETR